MVSPIRLLHGHAAGFVSLLPLACSATYPVGAATNPRANDQEETEGARRPPFDRGASAQRLEAAAFEAAKCRGDLSGDGHAQITFANSGQVASVALQPPFDAAPVKACIDAAFNAVRAPSFHGAPVVVGVRFYIPRADDAPAFDYPRARSMVVRTLSECGAREAGVSYESARVQAVFARSGAVEDVLHFTFSKERGEWVEAPPSTKQTCITERVRRIHVPNFGWVRASFGLDLFVDL